MRFLHEEDAKKECTFQDVFLIPQHSEVASRTQVDLTPTGVSGLTIPIVVANMTAVAGKRMAETIARRGGLVVFPQDIALDRIEHMVTYIKERHHVYETPVVLKEDESIQTALNLINKRAHGAIIVVDDQDKPVGIFTEKDSYRRDRFIALEDVMTTNVVTVMDDKTSEEIFALLEDKRLSIVPVVNKEGQVLGVMTKKGAVRTKLYKPALNKKGELMTSVAVRAGGDLEGTVGRLIEMGVDTIVLDTAHGHQKRMLDAIKFVRSLIGKEMPLVAGNIVTAKAAEDFISAGASILKVGVGPGGACTTRMMTGVGRPQFSAVLDVSKVAREAGAYVWADGGCRHPRDIALALAAGASACMVGTWFAGTYESPADIQRDAQKGMYKEQFGMASCRAVTNRTRAEDPFQVAKKEFFNEGVSSSKMYLQPGQESVELILDKITAGLRSACTYVGASDLEMFYEKAVVGVQTSAGYAEGKPVNESWV